jgi:hypothetical protein
MNKFQHTLTGFLTLTFSICIPVSQALAIDMGSVVKAQIVLGQV